MASSLRNVESAPQIVEQREYERQAQSQNNFVPLPTGISEMAAVNYDSILGSPTKENGASVKSDDTPTDTRKRFELPTDDYDPEKNNFEESPESYQISGFAVSSDVSPPRVGPKPGLPLPAVEGREGDLWSLPSQQPAPTQGLGLRVQNAGSDEEDDWQKDAVMHMNLDGR